MVKLSQNKKSTILLFRCQQSFYILETIKYTQRLLEKKDAT